MRACLPACVRVCICVRACVRACPPARVRACVRACVCACVCQARGWTRRRSGGCRWVRRGVAERGRLRLRRLGCGALTLAWVRRGVHSDSDAATKEKDTNRDCRWATLQDSDESLGDGRPCKGAERGRLRLRRLVVAVGGGGELGPAERDGIKERGKIHSVGGERRDQGEGAFSPLALTPLCAARRRSWRRRRGSPRPARGDAPSPPDDISTAGTVHAAARGDVPSPPDDISTAVAQFTQQREVTYRPPQMISAQLWHSSRSSDR